MSSTTESLPPLVDELEDLLIVELDDDLRAVLSARNADTPSDPDDDLYWASKIQLLRNVARVRAWNRRVPADKQITDAELSEVLDYAGHRAGCLAEVYAAGEPGPCTCGWDAVRKKLEVCKR